MTATVGIVGSGVGLRTHRWGADRLAGVRVVGVVGSSVERARALLGDSADLATDLPGLLALAPDVVAVTTPPLVSPGPLATLAEAGYAGRVLLEKPVLEAPPPGLDVVVDHQLRGHPLVSRLRALMGDLPPARRIRARELSPRGPATTGWAADESSGGGYALDLGTHLVDLVAWLLPPDHAPVVRHSRWLRERPTSTVTDTLHWRADAGDVELTVTASCVATGPRELELVLDGEGWTASLRHSGGDARLVIVRDDHAQRVTLADAVRAEEDVDPDVLTEPSPFRLAYPSYLREVVRRTSVPATAADGLRAVRLVQPTG